MGFGGGAPPDGERSRVDLQEMLRAVLFVERDLDGRSGFILAQETGRDDRSRNCGPSADQLEGHGTAPDLDLRNSLIFIIYCPWGKSYAGRLPSPRGSAGAGRTGNPLPELALVRHDLHTRSTTPSVSFPWIVGASSCVPSRPGPPSTRLPIATTLSTSNTSVSRPVPPPLHIQDSRFDRWCKLPIALLRY